MRMRRFIRRRFVTGFHRGQKGFTLIELLIVVVILGILAGVLVPRLLSFLGTGDVAAANSEVATVETAAQAYYADTGGTWPTDTNLQAYVAGPPIKGSLMTGPGGTQYINKAAKYFNYTFDQDGKVVVGATGTVSTNTSGTILHWDNTNHKWTK